VRRIQAAREQAKKIVDQAHKREVEIVEQARTTAVDEGKRIIESSRQDAQQEKIRARDDLRKEVATLAVAGAARLLQREIDPKAHADLIEQLAREIEGAKA
jgi:F-type H+-transporting ATPase subunit b